MEGLLRPRSRPADLKLKRARGDPLHKALPDLALSGTLERSNPGLILFLISFITNNQGRGADDPQHRSSRRCAPREKSFAVGGMRARDTSRRSDHRKNGRVANPFPNSLPAIFHMTRGERDRLLLAQLPQVRYIARRIHHRLPPNIQLNDLIHAGILGLMQALQNYDRTQKVALGSYAKYRIQGAILDSLRELDWSPRLLRRQARLLEGASQRLGSRLGRTPTETELAAELHTNLTRLQHLLGELRGLDLSSLEGELPEEATSCEAYSGRLQEDPYTLCLRSETRHWLTVAVGELPPRERQMLALYYYEELTMREVGEVLGVAEARVSQIHSAALIRLRARLQGLLGTSTSMAPGPKNGETHPPLQLTSPAA